MKIFSTSPVEVIPTQLQQGKLVKIRYSGFLAGDHKEIWAHIGFGDQQQWQYIRDVKMVKTAEGYEAIVPVKDAQYFHVVFTDDFKTWDNNNGWDYTFPIETSIY